MLSAAVVIGALRVKIIKIGIPEIITVIVLKVEQYGFTKQLCIQKMQKDQQTVKTLIRLLLRERVVWWCDSAG